MKEKKFIIFYENVDGDYSSVYVMASGFDEACRISRAFYYKTGYRVVGVCLSCLPNFFCYE